MGYPTNARTLEALGVYPYFIPIQSSDGSEIRIKNKNYLMIGSNNYLGLTHHPKVKEAAVKALQEHGTGCTGSRLLNGTLELHLELENKLARWVGKEKALVFSTGYQANLGTITTIVDRGSSVLADKECHASIIDAVFLAKAMKNIKFRTFKHNNADDLDRVLSGPTDAENRIVIVDGVYSMGGDIADLKKIIPVCRQHGAAIMVDDAHGIGVLGGGKGTVSQFGCTDDVDLIMGTFSKAFASNGGFISGSKEVIHWIEHFSRPFIFSASLSPASVATVSAALDLVREEPERVQKVLDIAGRMRGELSDMGFDVGRSETPIIPIIIGDQFKTLEAWRILYREGIFTNVALPPAVPAKASLLRTSYTASHSQKQLDAVLKAFGLLKIRLERFRTVS
ncbi:aminotransferase class I/II-fold pyridoxal phosphate-dependent enzyme [Acidobacteriota bacterium]